MPGQDEVFALRHMARFERAIGCALHTPRLRHQNLCWGTIPRGGGASQLKPLAGATRQNTVHRLTADALSDDPLERSSPSPSVYRG